MDFFCLKTGQVMYDGTRIGWDRWELNLFIKEITNKLGLSSFDAPTRVFRVFRYFQSRGQRSYLSQHFSSWGTSKRPFSFSCRIGQEETRISPSEGPRRIVGQFPRVNIFLSLSWHLIKIFLLNFADRQTSFSLRSTKIH